MKLQLLQNKKLQQKVPDIIKNVEKSLTELMDSVASMEATNTKARADVVVGETTLLKSVPVATLLFLEHKLKDLYTFVEKLPILDPSETWTYDATQACYTTSPVQSAGKAKTRKAFTLAPATEKHAAQVQMVEDEVVTGYWTMTKFSGAIPVPRQVALLERVQKLQKAVKYAREEANSVPVEEAKVGERVLGFLFAE